MNLLEIYVTNITSTEQKRRDWGNVYYLVADTDCHGDKKVQEKLVLCESDYMSVKQRGYYIG